MPVKQFHISIFYKEDRWCLLVEHENVEMLEALKKLILGWIQ